ncbi:glycosyltransferase family 9 protein [Orenia marismortui]|uniref:Heptosyltransferase-1 n=1 Tax=Orenia marismortui TaxID=46469 RepID=A0A4R8HLJ7_9FIRM|nr:glycosyltransferase family 9 protein [Orenia marismortui]TDX59234.1 heptosyltransferase-1 [Orenia marismortui]
MKILLIRLSAIGDVIHALPVARATRERYPEAEITWIVEDKAKDLVIGNPNIDNIIILPKEEWKKEFKTKKWATLKKARSFFKELQKKEFDIALDVHGLFKSGLTAYLSGAKKKIGPAKGREGSTLFYDHKVELPTEEIHQIDRNLQIAKGVDVKAETVSFDITLSEEERKKVDQLLKGLAINDSKLLITINPYTSWSSKNWLNQRWAKVADKLIKDFNCELIFTGSPADRAGVGEIIDLMEEDPYNLAGRTNLKELAGVYDRADLFIGCDTGPMHLAVAMATPVIALFGPTNPLTHGPYGDNNIVVKGTEECRCCWKRVCKHNNECMKSISVDDLIDNVELIIDNL